jgi:hypothetical protein
LPVRTPKGQILGRHAALGEAYRLLCSPDAGMERLIASSRIRASWLRLLSRMRKRALG